MLYDLPLAGACSTGRVKNACPGAMECDVCTLISTEADAVAAFKTINDAAIANGAKGAEGCVKIGGETVTVSKYAAGTAEDVILKCMPPPKPPVVISEMCSTGKVKVSCTDPTLECNECKLVSTNSDAAAVFTQWKNASIANGAKGAEACVKKGG